MLDKGLLQGGRVFRRADAFDRGDRIAIVQRGQ